MKKALKIVTRMRKLLLLKNVTMLLHHTRITKYLFAAFVLIVLVYAYFEARNMLYGPQIVLETTGAITVHDELVEISGTVKNVVEITLAGRLVFIDDTGFFTERLLLAEGVNRFVFEARDKFDNTKREVLEIVYQPKEDKQRSLNIDIIQEPLEEENN